MHAKNKKCHMPTDADHKNYSTMKTRRQQPKPLLLPAKAVQEMRQMAIDRREKDVPSPRGAAEFNFQPSEPEGTCRSNDDVEVEVSVCTYSFTDMSIKYIAKNEYA